MTRTVQSKVLPKRSSPSSAAVYLRRVRLESVAKRGSGHTPSQKHPSYWNGNLQWLSLADSSKLDKGYVETTKKRISPLGIQKSSAVLHPKETVVLLRDAGVGKSAILGAEMAVSQHFITWRCDEKTLHHKYLYQWLQWKKSEFERIASGSTVQTIGVPYFKKLAIDLPAIPVQQKIADLLFLCDQGMQSAGSLIEKLEQRKEGLMQQLLTGRKRLKGFKGKWKQRLLGQLFEEVSRTSAEPLPVMSISAGRGFLMQSERFNRVKAGKNLENYTALLEGEFAYNKGNSKTYHCGCIYMLSGHSQAAVPNVYIAFRPKVELCPDFYAFYFEADLLRRQLQRIINSGIRNDGLLNLNTRDFFQMEVPAPSLEEQKAIATLLESATTEIAALKYQLEQLKLQKRSLMQKLLSGQLRPPTP